MDNVIPSWAPGLRISNTAQCFASEWNIPVHVPNSAHTDTINLVVNLSFTPSRFGVQVRGSTSETPWGTHAIVGATFPDFGEGPESIERRKAAVQVIVDRILFACGCEAVAHE
jgi:hypothetical protein